MSMIAQIEELEDRAKTAGVSMATVCRDARVAYSSVWRAKRPGGDMRMGTFEKLTRAVATRENAAKIAAE